MAKDPTDIIAAVYLERGNPAEAARFAMKIGCGDEQYAIAQKIILLLKYDAADEFIEGLGSISNEQRDALWAVLDSGDEAETEVDSGNTSVIIGRWEKNHPEWLEDLVFELIDEADDAIRQLEDPEEQVLAQRHRDLTVSFYERFRTVASSADIDTLLAWVGAVHARQPLCPYLHGVFLRQLKSSRYQSAAVRGLQKEMTFSPEQVNEDDDALAPEEQSPSSSVAEEDEEETDEDVVQEPLTEEASPEEPEEDAEEDRDEKTGDVSPPETEEKTGLPETSAEDSLVQDPADSSEMPAADVEAAVLESQAEPVPELSDPDRALLEICERALDAAAVITDKQHEHHLRCLTLLRLHCNTVVTTQDLMAGLQAESAAVVRGVVFRLRAILEKCEWPGNIDTATGRGYRMTQPLPLAREQWEECGWDVKAVVPLLQRNRGTVVTAEEIAAEIWGDKPPVHWASNVRAAIGGTRPLLPIVTISGGIGYLYDPLPGIPDALQSDLDDNDYYALRKLHRHAEAVVKPEDVREAINAKRVENGKVARPEILFPTMRSVRARCEEYAATIAPGETDATILPWFLLRKKDGFLLTKDSAATDEGPFDARFEPGPTKTGLLAAFFSSNRDALLSFGQVEQAIDVTKVGHYVGEVRQTGMVVLTAESSGYYAPADLPPGLSPTILNTLTYVEYALYAAYVQSPHLTKAEALVLLGAVHQTLGRPDITHTRLLQTLIGIHQKTGIKISLGKLPIRSSNDVQTPESAE